MPVGDALGDVFSPTLSDLAVSGTGVVAL